MEFFDRWVTKESVLAVSLSFVALLFALNYYCVGGSCSRFVYDDVYPQAWMVFAIFLLSIAALFVREEIFRTWFRFTVWWEIVTIIFVIFSPKYNPGFMFSPTKELVGTWSAILFLFFSVLITLMKSIQVRRKKE